MKIYNSKTFRFRSVIYIAFISGLFILPLNANAFKVKTHVWVAQQVINDLQDDGALTFVKNNKEVVTIKVDPEIVQAILNNPSIYRMGNIGPDVYLTIERKG
mgnify:CR=1 FL=1